MSEEIIKEAADEAAQAAAQAAPEADETAETASADEETASADAGEAAPAKAQTKTKRKKTQGKDAPETVETASADEAEAASAEQDKGEAAQATPEADETAETETPAVLYGANITAPNLYALAGVNEGVFPFVLALSNFDGSLMPLPELGAQPAANLPAYAQNVPVTFSSRSMVETFALNMRHFAELWGWDSPQRGIVVSKQGD